MASLTIVVDGAPQKFPLGNSTVTLGRGLESDLRLKDIKASRRHCQVVRTPKGYQCVDLSSGNGTYVNGIQIKSQMLEPGDKITIGSTTIVFEEAAAIGAGTPGKSGAPKAATSRIPAAASPPPAPAARTAEEKPASSKTATARIPTARVPAAPTRKITARVDAVKPASTSTAKPAAQAAAKSGSRVTRTSGRSTASRPQRTAGDAPKKKGPLILAAIAAVVVLASAAGYFFFGSRDNGDQVRAQVDLLMKKAKEAEESAHLEVAIQEYEKALELCQGDRHKVRASELRTLLQQIKARRTAAGGAGSSSKPDPKEAPEKRPDFQAKRTEIAEKYKLSGDPSSADWSGAVKEWNDLASRKAAGEIASKAAGEIRAILEKAREDLERLRKRADALAQENKMAEAVSLLKQQLPRFQNTDLMPELETSIKQYDK